MAPLVAPTDTVGVAELGRVHFTGIGGAGMSGVARILLARGVPVSGTDSADSALLAELAALGARVAVGHDAGHLGDADTLVVSSAIRPGNPELAAARQRGLRVLHRSAALAAAMAGRRGAVVAGTHGKTTTTSMLTTILRRAGADPAYVIGGILAETGLGAEDGRGEVFVAEADESDGSFLNLAPRAAVAVVTCVEADHLDNYASLAEIEAAFAAFAARMPPGATLVICADDPGCGRLAAAASGLDLRLRRYGCAPDADYQVSGIAVTGMTTALTVTPGPRAARPAGSVLPTGTALPVTIAVPGRHNALNAAAALAAAAELGTPAAAAMAGLAAYRGAHRRMEPKGEADGVRVLDSYAHHPTELAADLAAAREVAAGGRVIAVFQPHLFSRTRLFAAEFGAALGLADEAVVLDVYPAREDPEPGVTGDLVARAVPGGALYLPDAAAGPAAAAGLAKPGDLVLTMGAGDVTRLGPLIVDVLRARAGEAG